MRALCFDFAKRKMIQQCDNGLCKSRCTLSAEHSAPHAPRTRKQGARRGDAAWAPGPHHGAHGAQAVRECGQRDALAGARLAVEQDLARVAARGPRRRGRIALLLVRRWTRRRRRCWRRPPGPQTPLQNLARPRRPPAPRRHWQRPHRPLRPARRRRPHHRPDYLLHPAPAAQRLQARLPPASLWEGRGARPGTQRAAGHCWPHPKSRADGKRAEPEQHTATSKGMSMQEPGRRRPCSTRTGMLSMFT